MVARNQSGAARKRRAAKPENDRAAGQVQSVSRALRILGRLAEHEFGLSLSDLAQSVGLAQSTTHRLLTTLQAERYVRFDSARSVWTVGVQSFIVGNSFIRSRNLVAIAYPVMQELMEQAGETANLAVENDGIAVYLAQIECAQVMRAFVVPGSQAPLHCSGVGKALLAAQAEATVAKMVRKRGLLKLTPNTITSPAVLRDELIECRRKGYAYDDEEQAIGLRCVASVIYDEYTRPLAALSVSGPKARIDDERLPVIGTTVKAMAGRITTEMGGRPPD
ncbi:MAG: helix-turn-helix domain-containing protein [Alphaproteobacteria bacterium]|nr:helix-turn-helix domain-containing protein [Alphaproteobacteria bacterium]